MAAHRSLSAHMGNFVKHLIENYGTVGLLVVIFVESGILPAPLPGDSLLFLAGFYASTKAGSDLPHLNLATVVIGSIVAAILGAQIGYGIGARWGTRLFTEKAKIFKLKYLHQSHDFFERRGPAAVVLARFIPFVRTIVPMLAGASTMKARAFTIANVIGALIWAGGISLLGFFLGDHISESLVEPVTVLIVLISLVPPYLEYRKHKRQQQQPQA